MPDLTNSYCERCGARYVFSPDAPKGLSLKGARVLAKGLKNFVLTDGQSMSDAMALARHDDEHQDSSRMTEAFHRTFNFCMTCRQYACDQCWNERVGACLSCSPEADSEALPLDDHMLVRTPVAHWDTDWSTFADQLAADSTEQTAQPAAFDAPIHVEEPHPAAPPAWPVIDLPDGIPSPTTGPNGKGGRRASRKVVDPVAASLWPLADEIAPEMTLTPEELELVETKLGQGESMQEAVHTVEPGPEPDWLTAAPAAWLIQQGMVEGVARPVERTGPAANVDVDRQLVPGPQPAPVQPAPVLLAPPAPAPQVLGHVPVVGRLLGRHAAPDVAPAPDQPQLRGESTGDPWPQATRWSERPTGAYDRRHDSVVGAADMAIEPVAAPEPATAAVRPARSAEPVSPPAAPPMPAADTPSPILRRAESPRVDARAAAAVRLSAVSAGSELNPSDIAMTPDMAALWTEPEPSRQSESEVVEVRSRRSAGSQERDRGRAAAAGPEELVEQAEASAEPPAPWPPLGASWPAQEAPGSPWPAPQSAPLPAIVAAQQASAPTLDEMWVQSAQQVLNRGSVRVCHRCALPVSTQARFCRRCGTKQA
jgi:ribosomal protein L40E